MSKSRKELGESLRIADRKDSSEEREVVASEVQASLDSADELHHADDSAVQLSGTADELEDEQEDPTVELGTRPFREGEVPGTSSGTGPQIDSRASGPVQMKSGVRTDATTPVHELQHAAPFQFPTVPTKVEPMPSGLTRITY